MRFFTLFRIFFFLFFLLNVNTDIKHFQRTTNMTMNHFGRTKNWNEHLFFSLFFFKLIVFEKIEWTLVWDLKKQFTQTAIQRKSKRHTFIKTIFSHIRAKYEFQIYLSKKKINSISNFIQIQTSSNLCIQYCGFIVKHMCIIFFLLHKHLYY